MTGFDALVISGTSPVEDLTEIEVWERLGEPTRFRFRVRAPIVDGDIPALADPGFDPGATITIAAGASILVRGPVTGQQALVDRNEEESFVDVLGGDRSLAMDVGEQLTSWSPMRASDAVMAIVAPYGFVPDINPTSTLYGPSTHELLQRGSDLAFVRRLAARVGYEFWVSTNEVGVDLAHFKPLPVDADPQLGLSINLAEANLDALDLAWDATGATRTTAAGLDLGTLGTIDGSVSASPLPAMASANLAAVAAGPRTALVDGPGDDAATLMGGGESVLSRAELFVTANGLATVDRVGKPLRAHTVVAVDGIGRRHSGNWLVTEVRHLIDPVSHRMEFTLARNGWER